MVCRGKFIPTFKKIAYAKSLQLSEMFATMLSVGMSPKKAIRTGD